MYHIHKWNSLATIKLQKILEILPQFSLLKKRLPPVPCSAEVEVVGILRMTGLNASFRGKKIPTDVLSFVPLPLFKKKGFIGSLVICLPVLLQQAKVSGHSSFFELEVLLIHGILHLLDFDHEKNHVQAKKMAYWEEILLEKVFGHNIGLIGRSFFDKSRKCMKKT